MTVPKKPRRVPVPSYAPIRRQIALAIDADASDQDTVTEICLIVAALAHDKADTWLQRRAADLGDAEAQQWLDNCREAFAEEIAAVLEVGSQLEAHLLACGLSASDAVAGVNWKLDREFFELRALARSRLLGW
jgi:hypothetical protein